MLPRLLTLLRDSLRGRLIVLAGLSVLATCALAAVLTWMAHGHERAALIRDLQGTSRAMVGLVESEFDTRVKMMELLASSPGLLAGDFNAFHRRAALVASSEQEWIVMVDLEGQQVMNTRLPLGANLPRMTLPPGALEAWRARQPFVSDLAIGPVFQRPVVAASVPVFIGQELRYGLAMVVTPEALVSRIDLSQVSPAYVMSIVDRTGTIVARNPSGAQFVGKKARPDIIEAALAGKPMIADSVTLEGIPVVTALTPSTEHGWSVVIGAPRSILAASMFRLAGLSLAATAVMLIALAAISWWILRSVLQDMRTLQSDAEKFARGQLAPAREWTLAETEAAAEAMRRTLLQLHTELRHRTEAEAALRIADQRFRLAAASDGIVLFEQDADLRYTWVHPEQSTVMGKTDEDFLSEGLPDTLVRLKREVIATGSPRRGEVSVRTQGTFRHFSLFVTPKRDAAGRIVGVAGVALDITDRKNAEEALTRAQQDLLRANAELETKVRERTASITELLQQMEEFTYSVSHDLRAPIRAMTSFSSILLEDHADKLGTDGRAALERIVNNGQKMDRLINDLLAFSRVSREVLDLHPVSLAQTLQESVREVQSRYPAAQIEVASPLPDVVAHPTLLSQVLINLLGNAAKFVAPGTAPCVRVSAEEHGSQVRLFIRDNGIGIRPELQPRLFRVFERLHLNSAYEGTGIGLAIVRRALERMGGRVGVESDGKTGSCFWLDLKRSETAPASPPSPRHDGRFTVLVSRS